MAWAWMLWHSDAPVPRILTSTAFDTRKKCSCACLRVVGGLTNLRDKKANRESLLDLENTTSIP